jgi:hypothetical protein
MLEANDREQGPEGGTENVGTGDTLDEAATGTEGTNPATGTERIEGGGVPGQTQSPAPADDVGVPEDLEERTE